MGIKFTPNTNVLNFKCHHPFLTIPLVALGQLAISLLAALALEAKDWKEGKVVGGEGQCWKAELQRYLLPCRQTCHVTKGEMSGHP